MQVFWYRFVEKNENYLFRFHFEAIGALVEASEFENHEFLMKNRKFFSEVIRNSNSLNFTAYKVTSACS